MAERNHMNVNDVYPILDIINRKLQTLNKGTSYQFDSPLLSDGSKDTNSGSDLEPGVGIIDNRINTSGWDVESFEVTRDSGNPIDPEVISSITIVYTNGAIDNISLGRGLNPPVSKTVDDYEYINNLMIVGVTIDTQFFNRHQEVIIQIERENGYGSFKKVALSYSGDGLPDSSVIDYTDVDEFDVADSNDFYNGGGSDEGYDTEVDEAEDYAESEYLPEDEIEPPESGWADGYNSSDTVDRTVNSVIQIDEDNAETGYEEEYEYGE